MLFLLALLGLALWGFLAVVYPDEPLFIIGAVLGWHDGSPQLSFLAVSQGAPYRLWFVPARLARAFLWLTRPIYGGHAIDAITVGHVIVLFPGAMDADGLLDLQLERHELEHVLQAVRREPRWWPGWLGRRAVGVLRHWAAYLAEYLRHGYANNRYEREARLASGQEQP